MKRNQIDLGDPQVREMDRLLRYYATDVFDSAESASDDVSEEQVETLMRKTYFMRRFGAGSSLLTVRSLSAVAMLMICCGVFTTLLLREGGSPEAQDLTVVAVTRSGEYEVAVKSPSGAVSSRHPDITITGDPGTTYRITIRNSDGEMLVDGLEMKGGTTVPGVQCFAQPLADDDVYSVIIQRDGKTVNDVGDSSFWFEAK